MKAAASLEEEIRQKSSSGGGRSRKENNNSNNNNNNNNNNRKGDYSEEELGGLKCPRCDSTNTKFCYYNNYSLTQPRHFCKTCRRYWTKGGALRNVPIGGGCRKTKKLKSSSTSSSSSSSAALDSLPFKFFTGISPLPPSVDFRAIGGGGGGSALFPRSCLSIDDQTTTTTTTSLHLASSIESLSSLNQDLHWKLQQQRLGMAFGDHDQRQPPQSYSKDQNHNFFQPILFHNLHHPQGSCFNSKQSAAPSPTIMTTTTTTTTTDQWLFPNQLSATNNTAEDGSGWNNNNDNHGVQAWEDLHPFTAFP